MTDPINIAVGAYDRTVALLDGSIQVDGFNTQFVSGDLEAIFAEAFSTAPFAVTELSFSNFLISSAYVVLALNSVVKRVILFYSFNNVGCFL